MKFIHRLSICGLIAIVLISQPLALPGQEMITVDFPSGEFATEVILRADGNDSAQTIHNINGAIEKPSNFSMHLRAKGNACMEIGRIKTEMKHFDKIDGLIISDPPDEFTPILKKMDWLTSVDVSGSIGNSFIENMCDLPRLRSIAVHSTDLTDNSFESFSRVKTLRELVLSDYGGGNPGRRSGLNGSGLKHIKHNPELTRLSLGSLGKNFTIKSLFVCSHLRKLRELSLPYSELSGAELKILNEFEQVKTLRLRGNYAIGTHIGRNWLCEFDHLHTLDLRNNGMREDFLDYIRNCLPGVEILPDPDPSMNSERVIKELRGLDEKMADTDREQRRE